MTHLTALKENPSNRSTHWLYGEPIAEKILNACRLWIAEHSPHLKRAPRLALLRVGEDPASIRYMAKKLQACEFVGIDSCLLILQEDTPFERVQAEIQKANAREDIDGLILQLPLPKQLQRFGAALINTILPEKDVDGLTSLQEMKRLTTPEQALLPCTAAGVMALLRAYHIALQGKNVLLIGRSPLVGRPLIPLLLRENASLTILHSHSHNIERHIENAEILIVAIGQPHAINIASMPPGGVVIDVGISLSSTRKLLGDVAIEDRPDALQLTPVPGGVGPMTVALLMHNTCRAYAMRQGLPAPLYP